MSSASQATVEQYLDERVVVGERHPLTADQREAMRILRGPQRHTCLVGGSRSGKTSLLTRILVTRALRSPGSRHLMVRFRANALRASVWLDTFPKVMRMWFPGVPYRERYGTFFELGDGSQIWGGGLNDKERVEKILGQEYATIYAGECSQIPYSSVLTLRTRLAQPGTGLKLRAYYDLNPSSAQHWTNVEFGLLRSPMTKESLPDPHNYRRFFMNPEGNRANLDPEYLESLRNMPKSFRERFYEGNYVTDVEGALWPTGLVESLRCDVVEPDRAGRKLRDFKRIVVAVDPSGAQNKEDKKNDDIGVVTVGLRHDNVAVVLEDATLIAGPGGKDGWGTQVVGQFVKWKADLVVAEANFGGGMVEGTIKAVNKNVPVKLVHASRGKVLRAEPVAALYEEKKVEHAGRFDEMEDEMSMFSRSGYLGSRSPNRADALVFGLHELMLSDGSTYTLANVM